LAGLPVWLAAILLVVVPTIAAMCGPVLMHRRIGFERLASNNEVAGIKFASTARAFSSEVDTGSRQKNAIKQRARAAF